MRVIAEGLAEGLNDIAQRGDGVFDCGCEARVVLTAENYRREREAAVAVVTEAGIRHDRWQEGKLEI